MDELPTQNGAHHPPEPTVQQQAGYHPGERLPEKWGRWYTLSGLRTWEWNPPRRLRTDTKYRETKLSMAAEGQVEPVVIWLNDEGGVPRVIDGNRRLAIAEELGWSDIWIVELPKSKDPARFAAVKNMKARVWSTNELMALAVYDPKVIDQLNPPQRLLYERLHREVPEADALEFAAKYAMHTVGQVRSIADYSGSSMGHVVRYVLDNPEGIVRKLREAMSLRVPPERLRVALRDNLPPETWWSTED